MTNAPISEEQWAAAADFSIDVNVQQSGQLTAAQEIVLLMIRKGVDLQIAENEDEKRDSRSFAELIDTYPDAERAATRGIKARIKQVKQQLRDLEIFREGVMDGIQKVFFKEQPLYKEWLDEFIAKAEERFGKEMRRHYHNLDYLDNLNVPEEERRAQPDVTPERVARAKSFPITDLLPFKGRTTKCIFHDDSKPSLYYYPKENHVYCFACNYRADPIDVQMKLTGSSFKEAVRRLAP